MEFSVHNANAGIAYPQSSEARADHWQTAAIAREKRAEARAREPGNPERVIEAYRVERLDHSIDARELRPITYDNSHLNKVQAFLTVAQNGKQPRFVDLYV